MKRSIVPANVLAWITPWIDGDTLLKMMKGALTPTIALAMYRPCSGGVNYAKRASRYQTDAISSITLTTGYLTALIAVISQCLYPRGKFLKIMFFSVLSTCTAAAICCLGIYSAVKARSSDTTQTYDSSACAVCGVWLLFIIW